MLSPSLRFVVRTNQSVMLSMEVQRFQQDAEYEQTDEVRRFRLFGTPNVVLDPEFGFGEPTDSGPATAGLRDRRGDCRRRSA